MRLSKVMLRAAREARVSAPVCHRVSCPYRPADSISGPMGNLSTGYATLGRENESLRIDREVYATMKKTFGLASGRTLFAAHNLLTTLRTREHTEERAALLREVLPHARERGSENEGLCVRTAYAQHLFLSGSRNDLNEAVAELEDICRISTRLLGAAHPDTRARLRGLEMARNTLARAPPT